MARPTDSNEQLLCSFCGKSQRQVKKLIAGPGVYICDECIDLCNEIIDEELTGAPTFDLENLPKPKEIYSVLQEYVVGQEPAKRTLSVAVYNHYKRVQMMQAEGEQDLELQKSNILLLGPDGLRQDAARPDAREDPQRAVRDRRRHRADRGRLRRRGRREHPAQADPGRRLRREEGRDRDHLHRRGRQDRAQGRQPVDHARRVGRGRPAGAAQDPRGHGRVACRRRAGASIRTRSSSRSTPRTSCSSAAGRSRTSTRWSSGASATRASASAPRCRSKHNKDTGELFEQVLPEDLVEYGLIPEFIGRLPVVLGDPPAHARRPGHDPDRAAQRARQAVPALLPVRRDRAGLRRRLARGDRRQALDRETGARGLRSILEETLLDVQFELPSRRDVKKCVVTKETIEKGLKPTLVTEAVADDDDAPPASSTPSPLKQLADGVRQLRASRRTRSTSTWSRTC